MFLITYDEHGGFYDHVAPPGTEAGPQGLVHSFPLLHPKGRPYLGVRVPTFVISPWVSAGSVCHTIFDHTAIIKTLLVRFRDRMPAKYLSVFGPRVNTAPHLGVALNATPRIEAPSPIDETRMRAVRAAHATDRELLRAAARSGGLKEQRDFRIAMRRAFAPRRASGAES